MPLNRGAGLHPAHRRVPCLILTSFVLAARVSAQEQALHVPATVLPPSTARDPGAAPPLETTTGASGEEPEPDWPVLAFHARIMSGVEIEREHPDEDQPAAEETEMGFFLEQAVVEAEAQLSKRLDLELGYNLSNQTIRDAFVNYRMYDALQVRFGRFKRPFSRLELRSRGKLPFRDRGLFNDIVLGDGAYVGRALAGMLWGKPNEMLRYFLSVGSPAEIGSDIEGLDVVARVVVEPIPAVSIGLNGIHKWSERFAEGPELSVNAFGIDARVELGDFEVTLEFDAAENPNPPPVVDSTDTTRTPWAFGFIGYAEYTFKVSPKWTLAPVVVFEWMDTDTEYKQDERVRAVAGFSWNYRKNTLRIMPQVEITRPIGDAAARGEVASETYYMLISTEI